MDNNNRTVGQLASLSKWDNDIKKKNWANATAKKSNNEPVIKTQLDLFDNQPKAAKQKIKEKQTYPFDTPQGIDHVTKIFKEESADKLSPKEEANLNILNKEMKLSVLKDEIGGLKKFDNLNPRSYPSDPEQNRRLKNIDKLEKSLGYNSQDINVPYKQDTRTPNRKKAEAWKARQDSVAKRSNSVLLKDRKYLDKPEQPAPLAVVRDSDTAYMDSVSTEPGPITIPEVPIAQRIKQMADARLLAEQKDWDHRYGKGGLPSLKRPE